MLHSEILTHRLMNVLLWTHLEGESLLVSVSRVRSKLKLKHPQRKAGKGQSANVSLCETSHLTRTNAHMNIM